MAALLAAGLVAGVAVLTIGLLTLMAMVTTGAGIVGELLAPRRRTRRAQPVGGNASLEDLLADAAQEEASDQSDQTATGS